jgi:alcohol dehydrogenase (cytochrome c)
MKLFSFALAAFALLAAIASGQVSSQRLLNADKEPQNWLMYSGNYSGLRYSSLDKITPANAGDLELKWIFQANSIQKMEASPLVVDGIMYATQPPNDVVALDAKTGRVFWIYQ